MNHNNECNDVTIFRTSVSRTPIDVLAKERKSATLMDCGSVLMHRKCELQTRNKSEFFEPLKVQMKRYRRNCEGRVTPLAPPPSANGYYY